MIIWVVVHHQGAYIGRHVLGVYNSEIKAKKRIKKVKNGFGEFCSYQRFEINK